MVDSKKYYWLKLKDDFFGLKEIRKLRKIAGGDTYTIIYLKLQLLSLKNEGKLFFDNVEDSFIEEMALMIDEEVENVKITIMFLQKYGLIEEVTETEFLLPKMLENIGTETQCAERVRKHRANKKMLLGNTPVTISNTEIEIDKEINKEINKKINKKQSTKRDDVYTVNFEEFWTAYPIAGHQNSKPQAFKNFQNLIKKKVSADSIIQSAKNYATDCKTLSKTEYLYKASNFVGREEYYKSYLPDVWIPVKQNVMTKNSTSTFGGFSDLPDM